MLSCRDLTAVAAEAGRLDSLAAPIHVAFETQVAAIIAAMVLNRNRRELS
jgi:hypothetical protein